MLLIDDEYVWHASVKISYYLNAMSLEIVYRNIKE